MQWSLSECLHKTFLDLPDYTNDINLLEKNLNTTNKITALPDASMEDGLELNTEQNKCMLTPHH
jgi:hypothetical protein